MITGHLASWGQTKPPAGARINWGHPLAQGLASAVIGSSPLNRARNTTGTITGTVTRTNATGVGEALVFDGSTGYVTYDDIPATSPLTAPPFTAVCCVFASGTDGTMQSFGGAQSSGAGWRFFTYGTELFLGFGGVANYSSGSGVTAINQPMVYAVTCNASGGTARFFRNGAFVSSVSVGTPYATPPTTQPYRIGTAFTGSAIELFPGAIGYAYLYGRALPDAEIAALYAEPYCFMVPR